jgi:hypothetical protein
MVSPYIKRRKTSNFAKRFRLTALRRNKQVITVYIYRNENPYNKDSLTANFLQVLPALDIEKLQEDDRGIFVVPKMVEFINSNL